MAKLVTVYRAIPTDVARVVGHLENRCLHPVALDDMEARGTYRNQAHEIRIAVPETEHDMALHILQEWEQCDQARLQPLVKATNGILFLLVTALSLLAVVGLLDSRGWWFFGLSLLLAGVAAFALIRWGWRQKPKA